VGSARSALFNWFVARQSTGGAFILRIEDTDAERNRDEWVQGIVEAMTWLGLVPDEGPTLQSHNIAAHQASVAKLRAKRYLYYCDCTPEQVAARKGDNKTPGYDGFCRDRFLSRGPTTAERFRTPHEGATVVHDLIRGDVVFENRVIEDFVVARSNEIPLYNLANVTDDRHDRITHVIRGEEHLSNAPKQILLWNALNDATNSVVPLPVYAHLPLLVNEQRKKLSKRRDPVSTESYRNDGYLAAAFVNYLALLGWSPRGDEEIVPLSVMVEQFRLEDVANSPAFFDVKKLTHMNGEYLRALSPASFVEASAPWVQPVPGEWRPTDRTIPWAPEQFDAALYSRVAPLVHERVATLGEIPAMVAFFFLDEAPFVEADFDKAIRHDPLGRRVLEDVASTWETLAWNAESLHEATIAVGERVGLNLRKAQAPLRCAVTGSLIGPPLFESLEILGRETTLRRVRAALAR